MKALLKGGLFLTLGWFAHRAGGQEVQWRAVTPNQANPIVVAFPPTGAAPGNTGMRGVSLSQPVPLGSAPDNGASRPVVRGQGPDPLILQPLPTIELGDKEKPPVNLDIQAKELKPLPKGDGGDKNKPRPMPKGGGFTPPPPTIVTSPVFEPLGLDSDDSCVGDLCRPGRGKGRASYWNDLGYCPPRARAWTNAEYMMWFQKAQNVPALITSSPAGTTAAQIGVLPAAQIDYNRVPEHMHSGGRFSGGWWSSHFNNIGFDTSFFFLGQLNTSNSFSSDGQRLYARPFHDVTTSPAKENSEPFSTATRTGLATIDTYSSLWSIDFNVRRKWWCKPNGWVDLLGGYRNVNLREGLNISEDFTVLSGDPSSATPGTRFTEYESFKTHNTFHGSQIGLQGEWRCHNRWTLGLTSKVAMGTMTQVVDISGSTTIAGATAPGALLTSQTNIGRYTQNRFAVVPEVGFKLGYDLSDHWRLYAGYEFLYISSVARAAEQIDTSINQSYRPFVGGNTGERRPAVLFRTTDYWAQGLNFGMQYSW